MPAPTEPQTGNTPVPRRKSRAGGAGMLLGMGAIGVAFLSGAALQACLNPAHVNAANVRFADRTGAPVASGGHAPDRAGNDTVPSATFDSVYALVQEHYVDTLPPLHEMSVGALRSMLAALNDPSATYLDADAQTVFQNEAKGHFAGIGAGLFVQNFDKDGYTDHKIVVVSTLPGSPAEKAGLRPHDVITHVNGKWVLGSDPFLKVNRIVQKLEDAKKDTDTEEVQRETDRARQQESAGIGLFKAQMYLRGDAAIGQSMASPGAPIELTVARPGVATPMTISVTPGETDIAPVAAHTFADGATVLKISAFTDQTPTQVAAALESTSTSAAHGLVLDLRGNAGGVGDGSSALQSAAQTAALLVPTDARSGVFAAVQRARGVRTTLTMARPKTATGKTTTTGPLVVLVDGSTAGAAEAFAAALVDAGHATLCGGRTFGDAVVQTVYPLPDHQSAFTLVTGRLLSPKLISWAGVGLTPKVALGPGATEDQILRKATALLNAPSDSVSVAAGKSPRPDVRQ